MQRSSGSAGQPAHHSEDSSAARPAGGPHNGKGKDGKGTDCKGNECECERCFFESLSRSFSRIRKPQTAMQSPFPGGWGNDSGIDYQSMEETFFSKDCKAPSTIIDLAGTATPLSGAISADSRSDKGGSAEQPVTSLRTAEQPLSSSAPHWDVHAFRSIEHLDAGGEIQPSKRCKYDGMMASSKDFIVPEILQPIKAALAEEIEKFEVECEQRDPLNFGEGATQEDKPKLLMTKVYERLRSRRAREGLPAYTAAQIKPIYAVLKGLLALLHSDVHCVFLSSSVPLQKQIVANDLYADLCSYRMQEIFLSESNVEPLALAVRQQTINNNKDDSRHAFRYLKYLADFAELHAL